MNLITFFLNSAKLNYLLFELCKLALVKDDPLAGVADNGVLQQGAEDHEEANGQVDVQRLHVRDFWQRPKTEIRILK
jgi:hypothetical protein